MCERLYNVCIQLIITMNQMWSNVRRVLRTMHNYNRLRFKARNDLIKQVHFGKSHQFFFCQFHFMVSISLQHTNRQAFLGEVDWVTN